MKKFVLPGLVVGGVLAVALVGVWWVRGREVRYSVERDNEINSKLKIKNESENKQNQSQEEFPAWLGSYVTPGVVRSKVAGREIPLSVNGKFERFEQIEGSTDKYLILKTPAGETHKVRLIFSSQPEKDIKHTTELSIIRLTQNVNSIQDALRLVGDISQVNQDMLEFFFKPGTWITAVMYLKNKNNLVTDEFGYYYARAVTVILQD